MHKEKGKRITLEAARSHFTISAFETCRKPKSTRAHLTIRRNISRKIHRYRYNMFSRKHPSYKKVAPVAVDEEELDGEHHVDDSTNSAKASSSESTIPRFETMSTGKTIERLFRLARPERHLMIFGAVSMAFSSLVSLAVPGFSGKIIDLSLQGDDDDLNGNPENSPLNLLLSLLGLMTLAGVAGFFRIFCQAQAGHRLVARLRRELYASILSQDAAYFDAIDQGDLISRLSSDAQLINSAVTDQALGLMRSVVVATGAVTMLFITSTSLAMVSVAILPPIAICARTMGRRMKERQKRVQELQAAATSLAEQALTCIRTVHQFVAESWESQQYNRAINQAHGEAIKNVKLRALFGSAMQLVVNLALLCVLGFGGSLVKRGVLSPGDLASFVMYSVMMGSNVSSISNQYVDLMKAIAAANRVFEIMDREPPIPKPKIDELPDNDVLWSSEDDQLTIGTDGTSITNLDSMDRQTEDFVDTEMISIGDLSSKAGMVAVAPKSVHFENVTFRYPTRPDSKVLENLDLSIQAGQSLALVGGSGAGKSTIASLLTRLYDAEVGDIRLDEQPIKTMAPQDVRRTVGIVVQEPLLFPTTIEANIRYGSPHATARQVREAARMAFVLDFADKFPDGLQTIVGPRGTQLSGGQKQRVAVARCILKNPSIVIFDESTSALDAESEARVQKAIDIACKGRTTIMIAHRLSTIRNADTIAVLRDGKVEERGTFDELMGKLNGSFRQLMEKQLVQ